MILFDPAKHVSKHRLDLAICRNVALRDNVNRFARDARHDRLRATVYAVLAGVSWAILLTYLAVSK